MAKIIPEKYDTGQAAGQAPLGGICGQGSHYYYKMMAVDPQTLSIRHYPDPVLCLRGKPVERIDDEVRAVAHRMLQLMHAAPGVGLAAPQVGLSWRMFVANATGSPDDDMVFVNPTLLDPGRDTEELEEGCLSLPDIRGLIRRPKLMTIQAQDEDGEHFELTADGLEARIWQHEYDHLDGILIIDRMARFDRFANRRAIKALEAARGGRGA